MQIVRSDHAWCEAHATYTEEGWRCKTTGQIIEVTFIGRSIHDGPFALSGGGRVEQIGHLHCPGCDPNWTGPNPGKPISPSEIIRMS